MSFFVYSFFFMNIEEKEIMYYVFFHNRFLIMT